MIEQGSSSYLNVVLTAYGLDPNFSQLSLYGSGLINHTWKINSRNTEYILQKMNANVFKSPPDIAHNIALIASHLQQYHPDYPFAAPLLLANGKQMIHIEDVGYFRLFPFVPGSHTLTTVKSTEQAFEAASQFGRFTRMLRGMDTGKLKVTIPGFHDLSLRYKGFLMSLENGNKQRATEAVDIIGDLTGHFNIVTTYRQILSDPACKLRVTHHDTKISNVLFNDKGKALCVIDLDTVMPGYFISDMGDMMRTYLCPVTEEESDYDRIEVRADFYNAIVQGYYDEMKNDLTPGEIGYIFYSGKFMIYMQALRFLTDYLYDDRYYGAAYPGQNFVRAKNQATLLKRLLEQEAAWTGDFGIR